MAGAYMDSQGVVVGGSKERRIPAPVLNAVAEQLIERLVEGKEWGRMNSFEKGQAVNLARRILSPAWPGIADWFGGQVDGKEVNTNAANAISEIAIPALLHCEEKHDLSPHARIALETAIKSED